MQHELDCDRDCSQMNSSPSRSLVVFVWCGRFVAERSGRARRKIRAERARTHRRLDIGGSGSARARVPEIGHQTNLRRANGG